MNTGSMFAPQWNYKEFESFIITNEYIKDAVNSREIKNLDIMAKEGPAFAACKESFKPLINMLAMVPKSPPPQLQLNPDQEM